MQAIGFPGAFASAAKIASRCGFKDVDDPIIADQIDKLDRCHAARRNGFSGFSAEYAVGGPRATLFRRDRRRREGCLSRPRPAPRPSQTPTKPEASQSSP